MKKETVGHLIYCHSLLVKSDSEKPTASMPWKLATTQKTQHNNATANGQTDNQRQTNSQPTPALLLFQATNVEPDSKKTTTKT